MKGRNHECEAVRTTIVGGRPPGSGKALGPIPRGIEVLVKKASVDAEFCKMLLEKRADAAKDIELTLEPSETMMLNAVPEVQLLSIIERTRVEPKHRPAFLGKVAAVMLLALGVTMAACGHDATPPLAAGISPDYGNEEEDVTPKPAEDGAVNKPDDHVTRGIRPDRPNTEPLSRGIRPDRPYMPETTKGIRPDIIESKTPPADDGAAADAKAKSEEKK
jgi:hypothetical protein